jgi:hypothetical protein
MIVMDWIGDYYISLFSGMHGPLRSHQKKLEELHQKDTEIFTMSVS